MISEVERVAKKKVIITTPRYTEKQNAFNGNPYQEHMSFWTPAELMTLGYQVRGLGLAHAHKIVWILAGLFVYFFPDSAGTYVCWKRVSGHKRK